MQVFNRPSQFEDSSRDRIKKAAIKLFADRGFDSTTTRELAEAAGVAEGTLFRHFDNKKAILIEVATAGWIDILTDLLTQLSEIGSYKAVAQVMRRRMWDFKKNADLMRVCFMEAQFHPDLCDRIQSEVIDKMTHVAEGFFQSAMDKGIYRPMNPKLVAQVFLGMFAVAGFSHNTLMEPDASPQVMQEMAEGLAEIFLNGVLVKS